MEQKEKEAKAAKEAAVVAKVVEHGKADKIFVFKYKAKSNYRKRQGHRQPFTTVEITAINA